MQHSKLSAMVRLCELLSINRSNYYYQARARARNLELMQLIDEQFLETLANSVFYGL